METSGDQIEDKKATHPLMEALKNRYQAPPEILALRERYVVEATPGRDYVDWLVEVTGVQWPNLE
jgi:hypothetical protein